MEELKDCPFCGSTAETTGLLGEVDYGVECSACRAMLRYHDTEVAAIQAWNKRQDIETVKRLAGDEMEKQGWTLKQNWISVKERLPEEGHMALVFDPIGTRIDMVSFGFGLEEKKRSKWFYHNGSVWTDKSSVTHWMPLPDPPHFIPPDPFRWMDEVIGKENREAAERIGELIENHNKAKEAGYKGTFNKEAREKLTETYNAFVDSINLEAARKAGKILADWAADNPPIFQSLIFKEDLLNLCNEYRLHGDSLRFATLRDLFLHKIDQLKKEKK